MNPVFFGRSEQPLFALYHPPKASRARETGVVLCYPMGQEYMRAHRAFRQLALLLTKAGFHVLRFDYFGTGDSAGDGEEATIAQWTEDVGTAIEELKDTAGVSRVAVVGLRLGASLAALASAQRDDVAAVVLWDPVVDGGAYVREIVKDAAGTVQLPSRTQGVIGVLGFPLTPDLRAGIERIDLRGVPVPAGSLRFVVVSKENEEGKVLQEPAEGGRGRILFECIHNDGNWNEVDNWGSALIPQSVIQGIVARLSQEMK